jgi:chaperone required for assembly of F1-ATPase
MTEWKAKRFWKNATVTEDASGWQVLLDGRPIRTPSPIPDGPADVGNGPCHSRRVGAQTDDIDPLSMPVTRSANSAIDRVATQHGEVADMLAAYAETDLLCHRAEGPDSLRAMQDDGWDPLLDWAGGAFRRASLVPTGYCPLNSRNRRCNGCLRWCTERTPSA